MNNTRKYNNVGEMTYDDCSASSISQTATTDISSSIGIQDCRAYDMLKSVSNDVDFVSFVEDLQAKVLEEVDGGKYSFELAVIGYDMYSDATVYDYDMMMNILNANGYCSDCAETFINTFAMTSLSDDSDDVGFRPANIVIVKKEQLEIADMIRKYNDRCGEVKDGNVRKTSKKGRK